MNLHDEILRIPCNPPEALQSPAIDKNLAYKSGHRDARHAAAELAMAANAEIEQLRAKNARLRDIVSRFLGMFHDRPADDGTGGVRWKPEVTTLFDDAQAAVQESK